MQQTLGFERIGKHWDLRGLKGEMAVCGWNSKIVFLYRMNHKISMVICVSIMYYDVY
jgi:hypothetical protein